jgi:hypothetical protein
MTATYKTPFPSILEMLDQLEAAGRTEDEAHTELRNMIRDGAVTLLDFHDPPNSKEWLIAGAILLIETLQRRQSIDPTAGALPFGYPDYFRDGVFAVRDQFEKAAGLHVSEALPANRRFASDEKLVAEALEGIRTDQWSNPLQAAEALASRAEGNSTLASKIDRLRKKIKGAGN